MIHGGSAAFTGPLFRDHVLMFSAPKARLKAKNDSQTQTVYKTHFRRWKMEKENNISREHKKNPESIHREKKQLLKTIKTSQQDRGYRVSVPGDEQDICAGAARSCICMRLCTV